MRSAKNVLRRLVFLAGVFSAGAVVAQSYPDRPVRLVVPFAPGGETDLIGRLWAKYAAAHLGTSIVVENKAGAGGAIGAAEVARAKADGYTLLAGTTTTQIINPAAMANPTYDPVRDFVALGIISTTPTAVVVNPSMSARSLQELVAVAKANPGKYSYGSAGPGTISNLTGELFKLQGGALEIVHVPYKGGGPGMQDVIAGHLMILTPILSSTVLAHHRAGRVRILAINSDMRVRTAPDIPTAAEAGMAGMRVQVFNALFAPAGTPVAVLEVLHRATVRAKADEGLRRDLDNAGAELVADSSPEKATAHVREEAARWMPIVKATGFRID
jgi:tripartite-type tricarboxylate transporter receptor subunit TctC